MQSIKSDDGEVDMESTRRNMQKFITWTKKRQKGARALREAQIHCGIKEKRLLTPVLNCFVYLMECLAHILAGTCKVGVQPIKSDDGEVDMESTRRNMQ